MKIEGDVFDETSARQVAHLQSRLAAFDLDLGKELMDIAPDHH